MYCFPFKFLNSWTLVTSRIQPNTRHIGQRVAKMFKNQNASIDSVKNVTSAYLEVIGSGADGVPASVMLVTNSGHYLINCGEGTVKLASEYKIKIHKARVFITYPSWKNIAGLLGMALAVQEAHVSEFFIHGDSEIDSLFRSTTRFIKLRKTKPILHKCLPCEEFSHEGLTIKYVFLSPSSINADTDLMNSSNEGKSSWKFDDEFEINETRETLSSEFDPVKDIILKKRTESENKQFIRSPYKSNAISFIFKSSSSPGPLYLEKCLEYKVPPGPLLGKLKNGMDVTLDNGTVVRSADVTGPSLPGFSVIALECPTEEFLDSLLEETAFFEYQSAENSASAVIHFSSSTVVKNEKYQEWISRFPQSTLHLFINDENTRSGSVGIHRLQFKLNLLAPDIFPLLDNAEIPDFPRNENTIILNGHSFGQKGNFSEKSQQILPIHKDPVYFDCGSNRYIKGETLCQVFLKPRYYDYCRNLVLKKEKFLSEVFESSEVQTEIQEKIDKIKDLNKAILNKEEYPKIVFLGTGSSRPSKVRNGSGILIFVDEFNCILLDCAEGIYGQLISFFGKQRVCEILRNLHAVYISHMHVDHQWGLITIIKERKRAFDMKLNEFSSQNSNAEKNKDFKKLIILIPSQLIKWLNEFSSKFEKISELYEVVPNSYLVNNHLKKDFAAKSLKKLYDLKNLETALVNHCPGSYGISITHKSGWKITYSGDTRPCSALITLGKNSDVLIHEATFENAFFNEAKLKHHSTTEEAIDIGVKMNAKYILLTHFSQRYNYLPNIESILSNSNIGIAFDFMQVTFNQLPLLPELIKPLQMILSKYDEHNRVATETFLRKKGKEVKKNNARKLPDDLEIPLKISKYF